MAAKTLTPSAPLVQGIASPNYTVDPRAFFAATRRMRFPLVPSRALSFGGSDSIQLRQTGILAGIEIRVSGNITYGGTIGTTTVSYEWPFNLIQSLKLSANGQSNLISCRGMTLRALEVVTNPKLDDSGLDQRFSGATVNSGTMKYSTDDWGTGATDNLGPNSNVTTAEAKTVDLTFFVPVAADQVALIGAVFAQSSATNLALEVQWATQAQLHSAVGASATVTCNLVWEATAVAYSIPQVNGAFVVPDLSMFHQVAESRVGGLTSGNNEVILAGTGVGRRLMRILHNAYSSSAPIVLTAAQYGTLGWAYGGSDTPEVFASGQAARNNGLRVSGVDLGGRWGLVLHDFASQFAARDLVDEAATSDLRIFFNLINAPTSGAVQVAQEVLFAAPVGA